MTNETTAPATHLDPETTQDIADIVDAAVKAALSDIANQPKRKRGRPRKVVSTEQTTKEPKVATEVWFREAWREFLSDDTVAAARDSDMRASFKSWLNRANMKAHNWHGGKKISDSYFNLLVSKNLRRIYVMKEAEAPEQAAAVQH